MSTHSNEAKTRISQRQKFVKVGSTAAVQDDDFENENTHTTNPNTTGTFFGKKVKTKRNTKLQKNTYTLKEKNQTGRKSGTGNNFKPRKEKEETSV